MEGQIDWQNSCREIKARGQYLLENEKWSDCRFLVGTEPNQQILSGHKLILAMASPVFERMFYGNLPDKTDPILIPDVQPDAFRAMMEYIYSDKINISSFDKACELCYVAKKYLLPFVVEQCTNYLWSDLCPKNACRAYEFAKLFEEPRLMQRCVQIMSTKTREVLADPNFTDIEISTLLVILDQDQLSIDSELDLFNAVNKCAIDRGYLKKKCEEEVGNDDTVNEVSMEPQVDVVSMQEGNDSQLQATQDPGEGPSSAIEVPIPVENIDLSIPYEPTFEEMLIKEAVKKLRFLTLSPQQFAEGPARSRLLTQAEALAILINISSPAINDCPMPNGFCTSRVPRNCVIQRDVFVHPPRNNEANFIDLPGSNYFLRTQPAINWSSRLDNPNADADLTNDTRKSYCVRTIRQQIDYRNTSVTDCALTFQVDTNILITGVQVPTQVLCGELMNAAGFSERYSEILYAHLLDAQGSRLTYTHCTSRVRYDSLLEISFDRPVFIHRNKMYKIGVVFNKVGWYPMYTCYPDVTCENVHFMFNVGAPHESVRDGLIRSIVFLHPHAPSPPGASTATPQNYAMLE